MVDKWTRRHLLGAWGAVVISGCLDDAGVTDSDDEETDDEESAEGDEPDEESTDDSDDETDAAEQEIHEDYDTTEVRVVSQVGDELGSVTAAIADTDDLRELGLSDTEELPDDRGMLFVFDSVREGTFVMRDMDFPIDIVWADADGTITSIHHAEQPDPGESGEEPEHQYSGRGQYVLEVNYEWTTERGVSEGDVLEFELEE